MTHWELISLIPLADWAGSIAEVLAAGYATEAQIIDARDFPPLRRNAADIETSAGAFRGLLDGERLLAVVETEARPGYVEIASLCVVPAAFRRGCASRLLEDVLSQAERSASVVALSTAKSNSPALALYRKFGFQVVASRRSPEGIELVDLEKR